MDAHVDAPPFRVVEIAVAPGGPLALVPLGAPAPRLPLAAPPLTLVSPGGYRVEGLAVESAAALLRALA